MRDERFDHLATGLGALLSRRALGLATLSVLTPLGFDLADAKKEKKPVVCTANCSGKQCEDNGCSGSCGSCGQGQSCSAQWQCVAQVAYELVAKWGSEGTADGQFDTRKISRPTPAATSMSLTPAMPGSRS